ncbi:OmpA family protein [Burkholderia contaminans]|jgi:outer membrane protein OmpA-like peptidoglycan-associated protein|uniref:OmpA family protein n=3 Tax=Burkholderia contaminans TaxID=488447 RepID=A0A1E3FI74_9BURK|nr:OmpA family protein [Burkholderia contaminans]KKL41209.1 membrane protein [Burkholderia contaminans LMG 23361]MBA9834926.1 OmpA family protein [Burkholderia contaminans]MBA9842806.1 OmpA family protein [Burkholderia contaminans]MBA9867571.1 OmpA family protein [Burkholderia contaminans]MBA9910207.1 OmpA family protein [Burkholderia contaminans]
MDFEHSNQSHWIPMADLMTGLMMVFMLLTAAFMLRVEQTTTLVVKEYETTKRDMQLALQKEFAKDLQQWNAEILGDMTIRFNDPTVLFATGSSELRPRFKQVLGQFFPRYVALLTSAQYKDAVKEIRIEGHTSALWTGTTDEKIAYFRNMELSQARTRSALEYLLSLPAVQGNEKWLVQHVTANGLSSSRPLAQDSQSAASQIANQRVEFRIVTNASEKMDLIAEKLAKK